MTVQAGALGLQLRQFRAFDRTGIETAFGVPAHWEVTTMCAIGVAAARGEADDRDNATGPRERRPIDDLLWPRSERRARRPPPYVRKNGWLRRLSVMGKRELSRCRHGGTHPGKRNHPAGTATPSPVASWPHIEDGRSTRVRVTFDLGKLPQKDGRGHGACRAGTRRLLFDTAAELYGFDTVALQPHVERVGFELDDLRKGVPA